MPSSSPKTSSKNQKDTQLKHDTARSATEVSAKPRRPARSVRQIRLRQRKAVEGEKFHTLGDRVFYAFLTGLLYGLAGIVLDWLIALARALMGSGAGDVFWLFTPFMLTLGLLIGFFDGKFAAADSIDALNAEPDPRYDDLSIRHDIFRGLGIGIFLFAVIWLIMLVLT